MGVSVQTAPSETSSSRTGKRVRELDGVRGIAILLVMVFHFTPYSGPLKFLWPVFQTGWIGVDLFFVLSGYLITGILVDTRGRPNWYGHFIARRSLRIFPVYYAALFIDAWVSYHPAAVNWHDFFTVREALWYFGYVSNVRIFLDNAWPTLSVLTPLWSLAVEEQFYLLYPVIVKLVSRKALVRVLISAIAIAPLIRIALLIALPKNMAAQYVLMPCRMDALAMGGWIAMAERDFPHVLKQRWIAWATFISAVIYLTICVADSTTPWTFAMRSVGYTALDAMFAGMLVFLMNRRSRMLLSICRARVLVWIGTISYGIYILHIPAAIVVRWAVHYFTHAVNKPATTGDLFLSMATAIAAAWISWMIFESPILKLKDRLAPR